MYSAYTDGVVLRDRDTTGDGTLDERVYYCQNWRADVAALVTDAGGMLEWVRFTRQSRLAVGRGCRTGAAPG